MPSVSEKQRRFMAACAHGAGYESCPPDAVSKEYNQADSRKKKNKKSKVKKSMRL